jgi:hypothetical protein
MKTHRFNERLEDPNNLFLINDFARIREATGLDKDNEPMLRLYRSGPDWFTLQIRTHAPITESGVGKPRNMIADLNLGIEHLELMLEYAKGQLPKPVQKEREKEKVR